MQFQGVRPDLVKYEMRHATGTPAWQQEVKKPGFFGRLLSGVGRIFGAALGPLSFLFPPAALASAGMYGLSSVGDQIQMKSYQKTMEAQAKRSSQNISFPGLDLGMPQGIQPASAGISPQNQMVMDVLFARDGASLKMANEI